MTDKQKQRVLYCLLGTFHIVAGIIILTHSLSPFGAVCGIIAFLGGVFLLTFNLLGI